MSPNLSLLPSQRLTYLGVSIYHFHVYLFIYFFILFFKLILFYF